MKFFRKHSKTIMIITMVFFISTMMIGLLASIADIFVN